MEWFRRDNGEVVFGEIGARPPGARTVDVMNFANDIDLFQQWAEALIHGRLSEPIERRYNAASIFKRAQGQGRITHIEGLSRLLSDYDEWVCAIDLLPIGAPRRDWLMTLISDGMIIVSHPDLDRASRLRIASRPSCSSTRTRRTTGQSGRTAATGLPTPGARPRAAPACRRATPR